MDNQWWIDTIGKLGPLMVAIAVFGSTRAQTRWSNLVQQRSAQVEDQKLRLALLDRRVGAVEAVRSAISHYWVHGSIDQEKINLLGDALRIAELVFDEDDRSALEETIGLLLKLQMQNRRQDSYLHRNEDRYQKAVEAAYEIETQLIDSFPQLLQRLQDATRVAIPPALLRPKLLERLRFTPRRAA